MHISLILAQQIMTLFDNAGADEIQRHCALDICKALVPAWPNSVAAKTFGAEPRKPDEEDAGYLSGA